MYINITLYMAYNLCTSHLKLQPNSVKDSGIIVGVTVMVRRSAVPAMPWNSMSFDFMPKPTGVFSCPDLAVLTIRMSP